MHQKLAYILNSVGNLGCFPECVVVDTDEKGVFSAHWVRVSAQNKSNFTDLFDETDNTLLSICLKLEKENIVSKVKDRNTKNWEALYQKYFETKKENAADKYIKEYLIEFIEKNQNNFFLHLSDKALFLPIGKFPFTWKQLFVEEEFPELLYCFANKPDWINYSLDITCHNKALVLNKGLLISRNRARVLLKNTIYEFDDEVVGSKLIPFLNKEKVSVSQINAEEYIQKVIMPLVATNRVVADGFEIETTTSLTTAILRIREVAALRQTSLFDDVAETTGNKSLVFELIFGYSDFQFWAGQGGPTSKYKMLEDSFVIYQVERDKDFEQLYIDSLKEIGLDFDAKIVKMPYDEGVEWINLNYKSVESTGVEIKFENNRKISHAIFLGERSITVDVVEERDWFDIKGKVRFGKFEIPFLRILNYIRQNKKEMILPNGEYVQIPQSWFEEYKTLIDFCKVEDGIAKVAKYHCALVQELNSKSKIKLSVKENMRLLFSNKFEKDYTLPLGFDGHLRPYQHQGYNWLRLLDELSLGGCLADDMGLGKTIQTLCLLQWLKEQNRGISLLVVPTSLVYNWGNEAAKFCPSLKVFVHVGLHRTKNPADFDGSDLILTSYAILRRDKELFSGMTFNYAILDEAQAIKNPQSDITQICLSLVANRYLTLTGTPLENSLSDLWSQVNFFNRNMLGTLSNFTSRCKQPTYQELYRQLLAPFLLRRIKKEVLTDLPEKSIISQMCDMTEEQRQFYRNIRNSYRDKFIESKSSEDKVQPIILLEGLLRLRQSANHPVLADKDYIEDSGKFETVTNMLNEVILQGDKVLVFSSFVQHLKLYKTYLDKNKIKYCYLDGSVKERGALVHQFQNDPEVQVFLLSIKAGGVGLNLTAASYVFLLDPWWNPAVEAQAYDRAHRIGQLNKVFVYKFITRDSIEEKILKLQEEKLQLFDAMISDENNILKQLNVNDVMKLIG
ncbi:MAG: DEAD/DEAH box helicase [Paludibacter sp.]|nr:DEAD/DEAH box helicase [Paludibacter sp.]